MKNFYLLIFALLVLTTSCSKKDENSVFTGITNRNELGELIGSADETDWNFTDNWNDIESSLFTNSFDTDCEIDNTWGIMAYPNPCNNLVYINHYVGSDKTVAYRIVNSSYQVLFSTNNASSNMAFLFDSLNIKKQTVRVYYKVLGEDCELRGHGDIKIN
jgi:hypothetical protein